MIFDLLSLTLGMSVPSVKSWPLHVEQQLKFVLYQCGIAWHQLLTLLVCQWSPSRAPILPRLLAVFLVFFLTASYPGLLFSVPPHCLFGCIKRPLSLPQILGAHECWHGCYTCRHDVVFTYLTGLSNLLWFHSLQASSNKKLNIPLYF